MYLIVEFVGEGSTGPVAKSWYSDGHSWWPPYKDLDRLLKSVRLMEAPQPDKGWTKHQARILHESASFDNISKKWKRACYTSDISESENSIKRIHKKKTFSSDDELHETPNKKVKMNRDKNPPTPKIQPAPKVPPAPKPPAPLKYIKTKGPVVRPLLTTSKAVNSFSNSAFVNHHQRAMEKPEQARFETFPSCQVPSFSAPDVPMSFSQADEPQDHWGEHSPDIQDRQLETWEEHPSITQENKFSALRLSQDQRLSNTQQGRMQTVPVSLSNENEQEEAWGEHPSNFQENTISEQRSSSTHQPRTNSASGVRRWSCITNQCTPVERTILEALNELDMKINHLTSVVQSLAANNRSSAPVVDSEDEVFPLTTMEELDKLERKLSEKAMMQKMVNSLSISGGHTLKKTIWRICSKVFGPVAKQLNWCGRGEKRGIRKTNIGALLIGAAMKNPVLPSPTEAEAEKHIKDYLRLAPGRMPC
ncbi:uncharacterized protein LOC127988476 isoform X2 [Carassius gibelio]|uniref:uncharacterized protein LOC127988476 isoform X2 n=1 Tax=Carassius gibelio TaxID=101364 RepID=UPI0022788866|nr:uncharacterized protein LOC127988476 isoform X2 [Carassius gibelio]